MASPYPNALGAVVSSAAKLGLDHRSKPPDRPVAIDNHLISTAVDGVNSPPIIATYSHNAGVWSAGVRGLLAQITKLTVQKPTWLTVPLQAAVVGYLDVGVIAGYLTEFPSAAR